jgi:hypothetical protein
MLCAEACTKKTSSLVDLFVSTGAFVHPICSHALVHTVTRFGILQCHGNKGWQ